MSEPRILIIDDNQYDRALALREIKKFFPKLEYQEIIDEASLNKALAKKNFDLVVTDYQLLWITGLEILYRIKKQIPDCPVVMFTGTGSEEIAVEAMKGGLDDYVIKTPRHYVRLAAAVRSAWQQWQQKQALEEFKQTYYRFFERVPLGLYRQNSNGEILEANFTLTRMLGYTCSSDLQGQTLVNCYLQPQVYLQWQQQLQTETVAEFEGQIRRLDGKTIWIRQNAIAVKNALGTVIGYEGAIADITNRKQAELERIELLDRERQAREEAEAVNRIKDEFLATLSHELRTPLNAIVGWMQLLQSGKMSPSQTDKALDVIDRNAHAQNQLINDLLDVSHIIRGTFKLELEPVNLVEVIKASLDTVSPGIKAKNLEVITQFDWQEVIVVNGDEKRLQQVFWNLFINALKFTPENGTITIDLKVREHSVLIEVRDTGQGISAEVLPYVFDRFRQAETKSSTRTKGGLGLGLAIVRHIIEIHGGDVMADSPGIGRGAVFTIKLPSLQQGNYKPLDTDANNNCFLSLKGLKILLVDDDADSREAFSLTLKQHGAEVIAVESVKQALAEYDRQELDILISELAMPEDDGYSLIDTIRNSEKEKSSILAIALTACASKEDKQRAYSAGFNLHISKPVQFDKLIESLLSLCSQSSR